MSSTERVPLLNPHPLPENYTPETVGFGLGISISLGGIAYQGYEMITHSGSKWPLVGFISTLAFSTFGLIRARQHDRPPQNHLSERSIDIANPVETSLSKIASAVQQLIDQSGIEEKASAYFSIQSSLFASEESKILGQLMFLNGIYQSKAATQAQVLKRCDQLSTQVIQLEKEIQEQQSLTQQLRVSSQLNSQETFVSSEVTEYQKQIRNLEKKLKETEQRLERVTENWELEKEEAANQRLLTSIYENQIEHLNALIEEMSQTGLKSPDREQSFEEMKSVISNLRAQSRESSGSSSAYSSPDKTRTPHRESSRSSLAYSPLDRTRTSHRESARSSSSYSSPDRTRTPRVRASVTPGRVLNFDSNGT